MYVLICGAVFVAAYLLNAAIISVFYHRGLAHRAVALGPGARKLAARYGIWLTGLDPKAWVCMQGLHHAHSDSPQDPHSVGEGYQNNHHRYPASAKFSHQPWEIDFGYGISLLLETLGVLRIHRALLIPSPTATAAELAHE